MRKTLLLFIFLPVLLFSQNKIRGFVYDFNSGEYLIGANVYDANKGTSTNQYGYFVFYTNEEVINVSYVGHEIQTISLKDIKNKNLNIYLKSSGTLNEIVLEERRGSRVELNQINLKSNTIASMPVLLGEADIFKTIQLFPGVTMGADGSSDFYVRGGSKDQNLIMIDDVPIYTSTHSVGYFSAINNEVVKDVKLYKGAFPSNYAGRVSSVLDIKTREGNTKQFNSSLSISPFILQGTIETPVIKNKSALLLGVRHSAYDLILALSPDDIPLYGFYDVNLKYHHKISEKNKIYLSIYNGGDIYKSTQSYDNSNILEESKYGNFIVSLRWNHILSNSMFVNTTFAYNNYSFYYLNESTIKDEAVDIYTKTFFKNKSENIRLKSDFNYFLNQYQSLIFGGSAVIENFSPLNIYVVNDGTNMVEKSDTTQQSIQNTNIRFYAEDQFKHKNLSINIGANISILKTGDKNYFIVEPRISVNYSMLSNLDFSASYTRMSQNLHLLTQGGPLLPEDIWYPSTDSIPPVISDQFTVGVIYKPSMVTLSLEAFSKSMNNVVEKQWQAEAESPYKLIEMGTGKSYGIESMFEIEINKLIFNINYTYSRSLRYFDNINNGEVFPFKYDRPHDLKMFAVWKLSKKWNISTVATYKSGNATTVKQAISPSALSYYYPFDLNSTHQSYYDYYGERNSYRLPDYFRWDIDLSYSYKGDWGKYVLKFGVYNLTNHHNAYGIYVSSFGIQSKSLLPITPYISYSWRLK